MTIRIAALLFLLSGIVITAHAQMPSLTEKDGRHTLLVDGKPYFILGGQAHNSSAWPALLPQVWESAAYMHLNTVELPVYWEAVEPVEGSFDFSTVDTLIAGARAHGVRLVLLWFGTWKNGSNHYMPPWMKGNAAKYPNISGMNAKLIDSPSPFSEATLEKDKRAFAALMRHLKAVDGAHTVIMVQVENEPGAWDSMRDYSPAAEQLFRKEVPAELLKPEVLKALHVSPLAKGNWQEVFGKRGDEYFHAWAVARFIGKVAAAGKVEYDLPLYVNAALRDPLRDPFANEYESGGPTDNVIPIWKTAAPAVDLLAPDVYLDGNERVEKVLDLYSRPDNALFVPEAGLSIVNAKYLYEVLARGGIGFSPFGIDNNGDAAMNEALRKRLAPYTGDNALSIGMVSELAVWGRDGKIRAAEEGDDHAAKTVVLGAWEALVQFGNHRRANKADTNAAAVGKLMFVQSGVDEFLVMGSDCHLSFRRAGADSAKAWQYLSVEEGDWVKGAFVTRRILNGDETDWGGPGFGALPMLLRIRLVKR